MARTGRVTAPAAALALAFAMAGYGAGTAAAQSCGIVGGSGVEVAGGAASYQVADGLSGSTLELGATAALPPGSARVDYVQVRFEGPDPRIGRFAGAMPLPLRPFGTSICAVAHAGASSLSVNAETSTVVAGGAGLRLARPVSVAGVEARPYGEVRGLWGRTGGTLLGVELGASGLAVGVEGGVRATRGHFTMAVSGSVDGFSKGLGLTPYPATAIRLGIGVRF